ncbi:MAG: hypothetical protein H6601_02845 [Flavobacteriales bacterium]|nr:hypothetical protein [Flavobacteriales bacterium]
MIRQMMILFVLLLGVLESKAQYNMKWDKSIRAVDELNLKGSVKTVRTYEYEAEWVADKFNKKGLKMSDWTTFNRFGNRVESYFNDGDGMYIDGKKFYQYDGKNQLIERKMTDLDGNSTQVEKYQWDSNGNQVGYTGAGGSGSVALKMSFKYNQRNQIVEEVTEVPNRPNSGKSIVYRYDLRGNCIEMNVTSGSNFTRLTYEYDLNGYKTVENRSEMGGTSSQTTYKHDSQGNLLEENYGDSGLRRWYKYDSRGNKIEHKSVHSDGNVDEWYWKYNDQGDCVYEKHISNNRKEYEYYYEYEYDTSGNWIRQIAKTVKPSDPIVVSVYERTIDYY